MKDKRYYIINVEGLVPAKVDFRVLAEDEDDAYRIFENHPEKCTPLCPPRPQPGKIKPKKISIRDTASALVKWMKNF